MEGGAALAFEDINHHIIILGLSYRRSMESQVEAPFPLGHVYVSEVFISFFLTLNLDPILYENYERWPFDKSGRQKAILTLKLERREDTCLYTLSFS